MCGSRRGMASRFLRVIAVRQTPCPRRSRARPSLGPRATPCSPGAAQSGLQGAPAYSAAFGTVDVGKCLSPRAARRLMTT